MNNRREIILQATLELVAEKGLQGTPVSLIAKRSGASAGIIYHYFTSKEEILRTLYVEVKTAALAGITAVEIGQLSPQQAFERMWIAAYRYFEAHRIEALFIDRFEGIPGYKTPELVELLEKSSSYHALLRWLAEGAKSLALKDLPVGVLYELSFAVAPRLVVRRETLDTAMQGTIASCCWQAIAT